jgi:hypothetical protein
MPKLDSSMGAIEIGVLVSTLFYGMAVVQSYTYFASSAPDRTWLKSFVGVIMLAHLTNLFFGLSFSPGKLVDSRPPTP